jgi:hypothetical protein
MAISAEQLHEDNFYAWTRRQAAALRRLAETRPNADVDFPHLVEEVEDLGSERLLSVLGQARRVIEHLLKLEHSPAADPRPGRLRAVNEARDAIVDRLTPTIRNELALALPRLFAKARKNVEKELRWHGEADAAADLPAECPYALEELLDEDWYPVNRHGLREG